MFRVTRIAIAAVLALAVAALPLMLDRCSEWCEAHQSTVANAPACHHAASSGTHIIPAPASCGHDHNGSSVTASKTFELTGRTVAPVATTGSQSSTALPAGADVGVDPHAPPHSPTPFARLSLPLRL